MDPLRNDPQSVPERYIQDQKDRPLDTEFYPASLKLPVMDFLLASGDEDEQRKLHSACKESGFFQAAVAAFCELHLDEKMKYASGSYSLQIEARLRSLVATKARLGCSSTILGRIQRVAEEVLARLSLLMGMDKDGLKMLHREMKQAVRMNYYPTCSRPDLVHGVSPHSDACTITFLLLDDEITALQIKHKDK
ncbi:hypothetical protein AB3S75_036471 [Citrus x aurantiifolia]